MSSIRPPAGRRSQIASITSRRPNVAFFAVNPLGPPSVMNSFSAATVPSAGGSTSVCRPNVAASASASKPSPSAWVRHRTTRSVASTVGSLAGRVMYTACWAALAPDMPWASRSASISARRVENASITDRGTPSMSASPLVTSVHSTPRRRVSSWRSSAL